ncbi:phage major capsid protein [Neiella sp. HB171785]|uniref:Phage major capsid protein n=1 Tax=Neiella litorisoli TaxID=2771431 RepID=A0A8J6QP78_9GAMM|nr:phage major capsid protein [Neiella litorisoli]MBD1388431.1 phage major capsid protein [Neiella litorisoli]
MKIAKLRAALAAKTNELRGIVAAAEAETRSMTTAESEQFAALKAECEQLQSTIEAAESVELRDVGDAAGGESRTFEMPTDAELRAFLLNDEISERSMDTGNTNDVMIPEVQRQIMTALTDNSPIRRLAMNKTTGTHEYQLPVQLNGATVAEAAENDARGETATPTLAMASATLSEVYAQPKVSQHLLDMNSGFDIQGFVNQAVSTAYSESENQRFADVLNDATLNAGAFEFGKIRSETVTGLNDVDALRAFTKTLKRAYRSKSVWLVSEDVLTGWESLKDADGKPLVGSVENGGSTRFLGYAVDVCEELTAGSCYFGDFNRGMFTVDHTGAMGSVVDRVTEKGQVKYYSYIYSAAGLADHKALLKAVTA